MANSTTTQKDKPGIYVKEHASFQTTLETNLTTTNKLCALINEFFRPVFCDYEGCFIAPNPDGSLGLVIYFKDKGQAAEDQIKNLKLYGVSTEKSSNVMDRIRNINATNSQRRAFEVTSNTKDALIRFYDNPNVNWGKVIYECTSNNNNYNNQYNILVAVSGISVNRVLTTIFGNKDENNDNVQYDAKIMRPLSGSFNYIISIMRLNNTDLEKFASELGMFNTQMYNFPIVTSTIN